MSYLTSNKQSIHNQDTSAVSNYYKLGYLFGRPKRGLMFQARSMRIVLDDFVKISTKELKKKMILKYIA